MTENQPAENTAKQLYFNAATGVEVEEDQGKITIAIGGSALSLLPQQWHSLYQHSVTLNSIGWTMAEALGRVEPGVEQVEANPEEDLKTILEVARRYHAIVTGQVEPKWGARHVFDPKLEKEPEVLEVPTFQASLERVSWCFDQEDVDCHPVLSVDGGENWYAV